MGVPRRQWPFVGRDRARADLLDALSDRHTKVILIVGADGVGKTRLVDTVAADASGGRRKLVRISAPRGGAMFPMSAIAPLLLEHLSDGESLARMEPVRILELLRAIVAPTGGQPTLFVVDDLPRVDPLSAMLISQLTEGGQIVLLATARSGEPLPDAAGGQWTSDGVLRMTLLPLAEIETGRLLSRVLDGPVGTKTVSMMFQISEGSPLLLRELVLSALDDGGLQLIHGVWHLASGILRNPALSQVMQARIDRLTRPAQTIVERLALCEPLELEDFPEWSTGSDLSTLLTVVEQAGLVVITRLPNGRTSVTLAHSAYADAIRASMALMRSRTLLLEQVAAVRARDRGRVDTVRLALWELEATGTADPDVLLGAARIARRGHEFAMVRLLADAAIRGTPEPAAEALLLLGEALRELGDDQRAGPLLERAVAMAPPDLLARAAVVRSAFIVHSLNRPETALELLDATRPRIPDQAIQLRLARAVYLVSRERISDGLAEIDAVDGELARRPEHAGIAVIAIVPALVADGRPAAALEVADELMSILRSELNPIHHGTPMALRAWAMLEQSGPVAALPGATAALRECLDSGLDRLICVAAHLLCLVHLTGGRALTAARWAREVVSVARLSRQRSYLPLGMADLALSLAVSGDSVGAGRALTELDQMCSSESLRLEQFHSLQMQARAWTAAAENRRSAARDQLAEAAAAAARSGNRLMNSMLLHDLARLGDPARSLALHPVPAPARQSPTMELRRRHVVALAGEDIDALADSGDRWAQIGANLYAAEAMAAAAAIARRAGQRRRAAALAVRSAAAVERCQVASPPSMPELERADPLSAREREIAGLAAQGLRSRDIAARLSVSVRTVDNHLQTVYGKLGINGRAELTDAFGQRSRLLGARPAGQ